MTGTRAEYGLLRILMQGIKDDPKLELQIIVTGMHLSETFGFTYKEIEEDGFRIDFRIETISEDDSPYGISESISRGVQGCAEAFQELQPDLVVLLGDRFEIFAAATAAMVARIPIAHIHGGESTEGLIDEAFRHSITKMSQLHFVAALEYRDKVVQLGESPSNVFLVGGLGVDNIKQLRLLDKKSLEDKLGFKFKSRNLLVTFHPVTLEESTAENQMKELLEALSDLQETIIIFTFPNADTGGRIIIKMIKEFVSRNPNSFAFKSLGQQTYLSSLQFVDAVLGNSSSGLTEVPSFKKGTINIGARQLGRIQAKSVINCEPSRSEIRSALDFLYSEDFQLNLESVTNPYGDGKACNQILEVLRNKDLTDLVKKKFYKLETK